MSSQMGIRSGAFNASGNNNGGAKENTGKN